MRAPDADALANRAALRPPAPGSPFVIWCPPPGWGFFANFLWVLDGISLADRSGLTPVVDMQWHATRFNERRPVDGTTNAWEYYFAQPGAVSVAEAEAAGAHAHDGSLIREFFWTPVDIEHDTRVHGELAARGRALVERYIRVHPAILSSVDELLPRSRHDGVLGVHVRGTDLRRPTAGEHPIPPPAVEYLRAAMDLVQEHGYSKVYLACDEVETVDAFRVSEATKTRRGYRWWFGAKRPLHRYLLGREVLVDALALARCATLLCGASNVPIAATLLAKEPPTLVGVPAVSISTTREHWSRHLKRIPMSTFAAAQIRGWLGRRQRGGPPAL